MTKQLGRPFTKGVSGNPGGRPRISAAARELAQMQTEKSIRVLTEALDDGDVRVRIAAAQALLDRGCGRPAAVDEEKVIREELEKMSTEALEALKRLK